MNFEMLIWIRFVKEIYSIRNQKKISLKWVIFRYKYVLPTKLWTISYVVVKF